MKKDRILIIWIISTALVLLLVWIAFFIVPFRISHTHKNTEIVDYINVSFVSAGALFTAFAFAATFLSLLHQHQTLNRQINLSVFSDTIRMIMDSDRFLECRAHVLSDYFKIDIENIKQLTGKDVSLESWRKLFNEDKEKTLTKVDGKIVENLRKSYERTMYFCGRMEYLGVIFENIEGNPFILDYYGLTIIETYTIVGPIIKNSTKDKDNMYKDIYKHYTNLYNYAEKHLALMNKNEKKESKNQRIK